MQITYTAMHDPRHRRRPQKVVAELSMDAYYLKVAAHGESNADAQARAEARLADVLWRLERYGRKYVCGCKTNMNDIAAREALRRMEENEVRVND